MLLGCFRANEDSDVCPLSKDIPQQMDTTNMLSVLVLICTRNCELEKRRRKKEAAKAPKGKYTELIPLAG